MELEIHCLLGRFRCHPNSRFWTLLHTAIYAKLSYGDARLDEGCPHPWTQGGMAASNAQPPFCMHLNSFETVPIYADYRRGRSACKWKHDAARCDKAKWQKYDKIKLQFRQTKLAKYYKKLVGYSTRTFYANILKTQGYSTRSCKKANTRCERMRNPAAQYGHQKQCRKWVTKKNFE